MVNQFFPPIGPGVGKRGETFPRAPRAGYFESFPFAIILISSRVLPHPTGREKHRRARGCWVRDTHREGTRRSETIIYCEFARCRCASRTRFSLATSVCTVAHRPRDRPRDRRREIKLRRNFTPKKFLSHPDPLETAIRFALLRRVRLSNGRCELTRANTGGRARSA